jgi:hypothetical protein
VLVQTPDAAWVIRGADAIHLNGSIRAKYLTPEGQQPCGGLLDEMDDVTIVVTRHSGSAGISPPSWELGHEQPRYKRVRPSRLVISLRGWGGRAVLPALGADRSCAR